MFNGKLKAEIASLKAQVNALVADNTAKDEALSVAKSQAFGHRLLVDSLRHELAVVSQALTDQKDIADGLRAERDAKRAKQLANLRNQPKLRSVA